MWLGCIHVRSNLLAMHITQCLLWHWVFYILGNCFAVPVGKFGSKSGKAAFYCKREAFYDRTKHLSKPYPAA